MLIAGIDEAGRGPVLGPMVLAVASIEKSQEELLIEIGVKDSKLLTKNQREEQLGPIKKALLEFATIKISPLEIDSLRTWKSLNEIEAMRIGALLNGLKEKPEIVFIDSPDIKQENFGKRIKKYINFETILRTEHKADINYPIVSAASIIAKTERDSAIAELAEKAGCTIGSGYPHDPETICFLNDCMKKNNQLPDFARKTWQTSQGMLDKKFQKKLAGWKND
ncbi:MAG: ribonuclease HII [Candidatus ainarchaeum sp.]|nr:ribonuclease HII [Candidatus ainarchaeum sp.]